MAALYLVSALTFLCVAGIILLAALQIPIPAELTAVATTGIGFLTGSVATAVGKQVQDNNGAPKP